MVNESQVIMQFACEYGRGKGLNLWPHESAPMDLSAHMLTAKHKLAMQAFDKLLSGQFREAYYFKFLDSEKN